MKAREWSPSPCSVHKFRRHNFGGKIAVNQLENFVSENSGAWAREMFIKNDLITRKGMELLIKRRTQTPVNYGEET